MPTLLSFLGCEKVIFEQETNGVSIISILHDVFVPVIRGVPIPQNTMAPLHWTAFALWYRVPSDIGQWFEQIVALTGDHGEILLQSDIIRFQFQRSVIRAQSAFLAFPVYRPGPCHLRLYLRSLGSAPPPPDVPVASQWDEKMVYPMDLHHTYFPA